MFLKVDVRENELLSHINKLVQTIPIFSKIKVVTESLPLGDFIIADEKEDKLIIERKTINDLLASIKDSRYEEQSYRLNGSNHHNHNIIYLIEGDVNRVNRFKDNNIEKLTAYSAMFSLNYFKGFSVFRSFTMEESALILCNMVYKLEKDIGSGKKGYYNYSKEVVTEIKGGGGDGGENTENSAVVEEEIQLQEPSDKDYISVIKKVKKENITIDNIDEIMLCQIPGISSVTSQAIINKFKSLTFLIKELEVNPKCLQDTTYTNSKGQTRKITKTSIENIVKFLLKK
jgi:ERCC4-type nuclease